MFQFCLTVCTQGQTRSVIYRHLSATRSARPCPRVFWKFVSGFCNGHHQTTTGRVQQHRREEEEEEKEREGEPRGAGGALRSRRRRAGEESRHGGMEPQDYLQPRSVRGPKFSFRYLSAAVNQSSETCSFDAAVIGVLREFVGRSASIRSSKFGVNPLWRLYRELRDSGHCNT